jgi:hypothetical protein
MHWLKAKLIAKIANGEPVLLNWNINMDNIKPGKHCAFIPGKNHHFTNDKLTSLAVLTPINALRKDE